MKRIRILVEGNPRPLRLQVQPNIKVSDVLKHLKLDEDYYLCLASDPKRRFTSEEDFYGQISNDEKLIARPKVKIDPKEAREDLMSLLIIDDDPSLEPIDPTDSNEYIQSFFEKE